MNIIYNAKYTLAYVISIVLVNMGFVYVPMIPLLGEMFPPMTLLVGLIFILRDFSQREIGHRVLIAMGIGCILSYIMADPFIAIASVAAFSISELVDWAVYTYTKRPLRERILFSSAVGTPIDSAVFLSMIGFFSPVGFALMVIGKMIAAIIVWWTIKDRE
jgi:uncharacterized PurR-regulated membrane protein YhhQ (DUF165 family)